MSQFIAFDAVACFNEIGEWLTDLAAIRPPTFADYVETVLAAKRSNYTLSDWEKEREPFERNYGAEPDAFNREYVEALGDQYAPYVVERGWRILFARTNRVAMYLNNGDVHALKTDPAYLWERLPRLWEGFCAIREKAGLSSSTPPWRNAGKCILPLVSDNDFRAFEGYVLELAGEFELMRKVDLNLHKVDTLQFVKCTGQSIEEWELGKLDPNASEKLASSRDAWVLPIYANYPELADDYRRTCSFEFVPLPSRVRIEKKLWDESSLQYYDYLKCKKCGEGRLAYRLDFRPSVLALCRPKWPVALVWQAQRKDKLLRALSVLRESWESLETGVILQRYPQDHPERECLPSGGHEKEVALAKRLFLDAERALIELAEEDPRAKDFLPLARDLVEREPGAGGKRLYEHELFRRERELAYAAIPEDDLAAFLLLEAEQDLINWEESDPRAKALLLDERELFRGARELLYAAISDDGEPSGGAGLPKLVRGERTKPDFGAIRWQPDVDGEEPVEDRNGSDRQRRQTEMLWQRAQREMLALLRARKLPKSIQEAARKRTPDFTFDTLRRAAWRSPLLRDYFGLEERNVGNSRTSFEELYEQADARLRAALERMTPQQRSDFERAAAQMTPERRVEVFQVLASDPDAVSRSFGTAPYRDDDEPRHVF